MKNLILCLSLLALFPTTAHAEITLDMVTIWNPGNDPPRYRVYGGVDYIYGMGMYEITSSQYTTFLNSVASNDSYELYNPMMTYVQEGPELWEIGCQIQRHGESGSYTYSVPDDWANRPVNLVTWADSIRFINWLHNGQPEGVLTGDPIQDAGLTEGGSYNMDGAMGLHDLVNVERQSGATWMIPTVDEWTKAGHHEGGDKWRGFSMSEGGVPSNEIIDPDPGRNGNFDYDQFDRKWGSLPDTYLMTEVGEFENSDSYYGTFDQGGNVHEWLEDAHNYSRRSDGGCFMSPISNIIMGGTPGATSPYWDTFGKGFRVALLIEPESVLFPGDANLNGRVDVVDFNVWNSNKFTDGNAWEDGDFTGDGRVDIADFNAWNSNKFTRSPSWTSDDFPNPSPLGIKSVPEPSMIVLLGSLLGMILFRLLVRKGRTRSH